MEKYHVLVVEDDNEIANAIKIYLQNQGYDVYVGNDGLEGLEIVEKETIHLAIVDIMMPRMDGLTMVAKLRVKYDFPVIFLSAKSEDIDKIMGLNLGGDDYVTKPFVPMELMARVRSHLRRYGRYLDATAPKESDSIYLCGGLLRSRLCSARKSTLDCIGDFAQCTGHDLRLGFNALLHCILRHIDQARIRLR